MSNNGFFYGGEVITNRLEYVNPLTSECVIYEKQERYFAYNAQSANIQQCANVPQPPYSLIPYQPNYNDFVGFLDRAAIGFSPPFATAYYPERENY